MVPLVSFSTLSLNLSVLYIVLSVSGWLMVFLMTSMMIPLSILRFDLWQQIMLEDLKLAYSWPCLGCRKHLYQRLLTNFVRVVFFKLNITVWVFDCTSSFLRNSPWMGNTLKNIHTMLEIFRILFWNKLFLLYINHNLDDAVSWASILMILPSTQNMISHNLPL